MSNIGRTLRPPTRVEAPPPRQTRRRLTRGEFAGLFEGLTTPPPGYGSRTRDGKIGLKTSANLPGPLDEHWRVPLVDATLSGLGPDAVADLAAWLREHQPISLAVNGESPFPLMRQLFERTGLVVYTVGDMEMPALTAQVASYLLPP